MKLIGMGVFYMEKENSFVEHFLLTLQSEGLKEASVKRYRYDLYAFLRYLEKHYYVPVAGNEIKDITDEQVQAYMNSISDTSESNIRRVVRVLNRLLSFYPLSDERKVIELPVRSERILKDSDFARDWDVRKLVKSMKSNKWVNDHQATARFYIGERNLSIVLLMIEHGLTVGEIERITMNDINFGQDTIQVFSPRGKSRIIQLDKEHKKLIYNYYSSIPLGVRPYLKSPHSLFVAFLPTNNSFVWDYNKDEPKGLSRRSIQYVLSHEAEIAGVIISARTLRNRYILNQFLKGKDWKEIAGLLGYTNTRALWPYQEYVKSQT
jgi:site-specific recombinase XerD